MELYAIVGIIGIILVGILIAVCRRESYSLEHFTAIRDHPAAPENTRYVYWTGGYDSTFAILQVLANTDLSVQPIYISAIIDNDPDSKVRRQNHQQEIKAIHNIASTIRERFPNRLLDVWFVDKVEITDTVAESMKTLHQRGMVRRPVCQYGALAQYSLDLDQPVDLAVHNEIPKTSMMYKAIHDKIDHQMIKPQLFNTQPELAIYRQFRFPTLHLTKQDMYKYAKDGGYDDILHDTWSCWYPTKRGEPCGRCIMCRERII